LRLVIQLLGAGHGEPASHGIRLDRAANQPILWVVSIYLTRDDLKFFDFIFAPNFTQTEKSDSKAF